MPPVCLVSARANWAAGAAMTQISKPRIQSIVDRYAGKTNLGEIAVSVGSADGSSATHAAAGTHAGRPIDEVTPFFLASTTKLIAAALAFRLAEEGRLSLDTPVISFFPAGMLDRLHVLKGVDYTAKITVRHLLSHTSGLPDYFEQKRKDGTLFTERLFSGEDPAWSLEDVIAAARDDLTPPFAPGTPGKAFYSDTNFQLLGGIIEAVTGLTAADAVRTMIAEPLGLTQTRLPAATDDVSHVVPLRNGTDHIRIPRAIESTRLDGGGVSTSAELLTFARGFYGAALFDIAPVMAMQEWRRIFFPLQYGTGMMRFHTPWFFSPFKRQPDLVGHSGISGAFAYAAPSRNVVLAGTINQLADRALPYRFLLELLNALD